MPQSPENKMAKWYEDVGFANKVCELVYDNYKRLGKKEKAIAGREWTILAAVVVVFEQKQGNGTLLTVYYQTFECLNYSIMSMAVNLNLYIKILNS